MAFQQCIKNILQQLNGYLLNIFIFQLLHSSTSAASLLNNWLLAIIVLHKKNWSTTTGAVTIFKNFLSYFPSVAFKLAESVKLAALKAVLLQVLFPYCLLYILHTNHQPVLYFFFKINITLLSVATKNDTHIIYQLKNHRIYNVPFFSACFSCLYNNTLLHNPYNSAPPLVLFL